MRNVVAPAVTVPPVRHAVERAGDIPLDDRERSPRCRAETRGERDVESGRFERDAGDPNEASAVLTPELLMEVENVLVG